MLHGAWQAITKPQWCATINVYCSPFWSHLGVSQALLLVLAGLAPTSGGWLAFGWSRLVLSGANEVAEFFSTCISSFSVLAQACSPGNDKVEESKRNHTGPLKPDLELAHSHFYWPYQVTWPKQLLFYGRNCKIMWQRVWIQERERSWDI